jgi:hypothetical protein
MEKTSEQMTSPCFSFPGHQGNRLFELFICSESGKPVYFYNKDRDDDFVVTLMGLVQAMVSFFQDAQSDDLKTITSIAGMRITFAVKSPLIIVLFTHVTSSIDPVLVINQVNAEIVSILTFKTLKSVFEQKPTYDLRRLLGGSEKLIDTLIDEGLLKNQLCMRRKVKYSPSSPHERPPQAMIHAYLTSYTATTPNVSSLSKLTSGYSPSQQIQHSVVSSQSSSALFSQRCLSSRSLIPVLSLNPTTRESITNAVSAAVSSTSSSVLFALLFQRKISRSASEVLPGEESVVKCKENNGDIDLDSNLLITVHNNSPKQAKLNPLDIQLLSTLVVASEGQLSSAESLWLPVCIPRVDPSAFIHGHISYINTSGSASSSSSPGSTQDSHLQEKLCLVLLTIEREDFNKCQHIRDNLCEKLNKVRISPSPFSELCLPQLDMFCYLAIKPHCIVYRNQPCVGSTQFHPLINWLSSRMTGSGYKTFWFTSLDDSISLLGWHSPTFVIYFQFDACTTHGDALSIASQVVKWIKKEEDKIKLKDYQ